MVHAREGQHQPAFDGHATSDITNASAAGGDRYVVLMGNLHGRGNFGGGGGQDHGFRFTGGEPFVSRMTGESRRIRVHTVGQGQQKSIDPGQHWGRK